MRGLGRGIWYHWLRGEDFGFVGGHCGLEGFSVVLRWKLTSCVCWCFFLDGIGGASSRGMAGVVRECREPLKSPQCVLNSDNFSKVWRELQNNWDKFYFIVGYIADRLVSLYLQFRIQI